ncbi:MAG: conserved membrane protein of unknown function [Candidatus Thorarchaeota archaeon]|nr:MAG: conserved membrane protein of unknown function [Candidatus Thorarchaeota archaeon]
MNFRILTKSMKFAFRATKRVTAFIIIYAILIVLVAKGLQGAVTLPGGYGELPWLLMAFVVATLYAILISQFRRKDIAILKCVSWNNSDIMLLIIGEVVLVALSAFLVVFQLSVEILGLIAYFDLPETGTSLLHQVHDIIALQAAPMITALFYVVILQLPGLIFAQLRAMRIPPMRALREE